MGFPGGAVVKNLPVNARDVTDMGLIPGCESPLVDEMAAPLQYSCLQNLMDTED